MTAADGDAAQDARPERNPIAPPQRRPLKIYAFDPMLREQRAQLTTLTIDIANEDLDVGPAGRRVRIVDYDGATGCFYEPVDLDDPAILMQGGLEPTEADPRFHQQMVYAVATRVLENFDKALGRKLTFERRRPLTLSPHAFRGANAFYDPEDRAIRFGYFTADRANPGPNLPGQTVFTCLSHDIIAHEMTHAIVHRLREHFLLPTNRDMLAFHEGFSDIVAIFQHFTFREVLRSTIQRTQGDLRSPSELISLATQFGYATGHGEALRSASEQKQPDPRLYDEVFEPHERGSILVAAVFDAFFRNYQRRIEDLLRIATGGTGRLPEGALHPDLVERIAQEATRAADIVLTMAIRAFEYLPPVDITFGDYLRALVTADYDLVAEAGIDQRRSMIEAFRIRGIYPERVTSLAEESLLWPGPEDKMEPIPEDGLADAYSIGARRFRRRGPNDSGPGNPPFDGDDEASAQARIEREISDRAAKALHAWATRNAAALALHPKSTIKVEGFHPIFRVSPRGELHIEIVAQFGQIKQTEPAEYGGLPIRGGTTVVASADGAVRYVISKPIPSDAIGEEKRNEADARVERQRAFVELCDRHDPALPWRDEDYVKTRMTHYNFRALHQGLIG